MRNNNKTHAKPHREGNGKNNLPQTLEEALLQGYFFDYCDDASWIRHLTKGVGGLGGWEKAEGEIELMKSDNPGDASPALIVPFTAHLVFGKPKPWEERQSNIG